MKLSKNRICGLLKIKNQSNKKYKKRKNKSPKRGRSFRKNKKPLNLRRKSLQRKRDRGRRSASIPPA